MTKMPTGTKKPRGWFTRTVREVLEPRWAEERLKLGEADRWEIRDTAWEEVQDRVGIGGIIQLAYERYCSSESQVLTSNQTNFRDAVKAVRRKLESQGILPLPVNGADPSATQLVIQEIHTALYPIRETDIKRPGVDRDFSKVISVADIDFEIVYEMVTVRDQKRRETELSVEDYNFLDDARRAVKASKQSTLGQVFKLYDQSA